MTKPSVGRIVHYRSYGTPGGEYEPECRAAIITEINPNDIGIAVLNPTGLHFDRQIRQSEGDHTGGTWHWPCVITNDEDN